jgi:xanthine dehydrogenase accessory factor
MADESDVYPDLFEEMVRLRRAGHSLVMATVVSVEGSAPRHVGARMLVLRDGSIRGTIGGGVREAEVIAEAMRLFKKGESRLLGLDFREGLRGGEGPLCGGRMEVFMERIDPPRLIVIAGAGHIAYFLHRFLSLLELRTLVFDERPEFAAADRFPGAELHVESFETGLRSLSFSANDGIVIVTPDHKYDQVVLRQALDTDAGYIGMIASKRKVKTVFDNLRSEGVGEDRLAGVHSPIGLDIGAETPAEIALAIAAEIVAVFKTHAQATSVP